MLSPYENAVLEQYIKNRQSVLKTLKNERVGHACMNVIDLFEIYKRHILTFSKKSDRDYIKEVFSKTELFDVSLMEMQIKREFHTRLINDKVIGKLPNEITLPFECCFIKVYDDAEETNGVFIREYNPEYLTGAILIVSRRFGQNIEISVPFTIALDTQIVTIEIKALLKEFRRVYSIPQDLEELSDLYKVMFDDVVMMVSLALNPIDCLKDHTIVVDHTNKKEYYARKGKPTIKVENRPIYYVLNKKERYDNRITPITHLEYSHSFRVRGHWRHHNGIGKNRQGVYNVEGYTWVTDYLKGEGELVKRVRVVK